MVLLAPYLTPENADELLAAAAHQSQAGIEQLLAQRFPRPEMMPLVEGSPHLHAAAEPATRPGAS